jgi:hypothetical protein
MHERFKTFSEVLGHEHYLRNSEKKSKFSFAPFWDVQRRRERDSGGGGGVCGGGGGGGREDFAI